MNTVIIPSAKVVSLKESWKKEDIIGCIDNYCKSLQDIAYDIIKHQNILVTSNCCVNTNIFYNNNQDRRVGGDRIETDVMVYEEEEQTIIDKIDIDTLTNKDIKYTC